MARAAEADVGVERAMATTPILSGVAKQQVKELARSGQVRRFRRGTYICHQGDVADDVYFLVEGRVEISSVSPTGTRVLHATVDLPQFLGELGLFGGLSRSADLLALDDCDVWAGDGEQSV